MVTDWVLFRRAAHELESQLRGAKVREAGLLPDGRLGLALRSRSGTTLLAIDAFGTPPSLSLEDGEGSIRAEAGFVRALAGGLRDTTFLGARARRGDRLIRLLFGSRSRFGVGDEFELYLELVPRFGNVVLVKGGVVVAAAKEFSLAENGSRAVQAGMRYAPPPARPGSVVPKIVLDAGNTEETFLPIAEGDEAMREPLYVYRTNGALVAAHVVPLRQFPDADASREPSMLALLREMRADREGSGERIRTARRRASLVKRLDERERKLRDELRWLEAKRQRAGERDALREEGERIYGSLHEIGDEEREEAKDRAAKLFMQYKKLGTALPHIETREQLVRSGLEAVESLRWETERAADDLLDDVEAAVAQMDPNRKQQRREAPRKKKRRAPLEYRTAGGSRIVVGRSPAENADVTFTIGRPNDLWFHTQGIPGAHVILARDDRTEAPQDDIETAASLAALYSKGKASAKVAVDYTLRKHVRKQQNAPPGLVWYTHPATVLVAPAAPDRPEDADSLG
jgi:predicted ribosome quality control (RQC) complex YloA/Tae2 family protein